MTRPPLSKQRLTQEADGRYRIALKAPWRDGTTHLLLEGPELVGRLLALVPPPRFHLTRYFGVFAPRAKLRRAVVPGYGAAQEGACCPGVVPPAVAPPAVATEPAEESPVTARRRMSWSKLLARVFAVDVLSCPKCGSSMQRVEVCTSAQRMAAALDGLEDDTGPPARRSAA